MSQYAINREIELRLSYEADYIRRHNRAKSPFTEAHWLKRAKEERDKINKLYYGANKQGRI